MARPRVWFHDVDFKGFDSVFIIEAMQRNPLERVVEAEKSFAGMHVRIAAEDMVGLARN